MVEPRKIFIILYQHTIPMRDIILLDIVDHTLSQIKPDLRVQAARFLYNVSREKMGIRSI